MNTNSLYRKMLMGIGLLAALFVLGGAFAFSSAPAAAQVEESADSAADAESPSRKRGRRGGLFADRTTINEAIADALGITVEELEAAYADGTHWQTLADELGLDAATVQAAINDAIEAGIAAAVEDGTLTQEEADALLERMALHELAQTIVDRDVIRAAIADALGVTTDELEAAKEAGTLRELVEASGVIREALREAVQAARQQQIEQAVADGLITQEQADQLLEGRIGRGFGRGGLRGHGFPGLGSGTRPDGQGFGGPGRFNRSTPPVVDTIDA